MLSVNSSQPVFAFEDAYIRIDKSDESITNQVGWHWSVDSGDRLAVLTSNSFLRYQLIAVLAGLVPAVAGRQIRQGVIGWPLGGEGGLDGRLKIGQNVDFVCRLYEDCLQSDYFSLEAFWTLLAEEGIETEGCLRDLNSSQKRVFFTALSLLFHFDLHLVPRTRFLMSKAGTSLRQLFLKQSEGAALVTTSTNARFLRQFCDLGLVLSPSGEPLFFGGLDEALARFDQSSTQDDSDDSDDSLIQGLNLQNSDREANDQDDIL